MPNGSTAQKENLVRAAVEVVYGAVEPLRIWSPMLFPADGKLVVQDIQRAFPIFFCCIRDLANAQKFLDDKADAAAKADFGLLHYNIIEISTRCSFALNFIGSYSADEQIYLSLIRDRIVHGFLKGTSNEIRSVLIARSGDLRQEKFKQMQLTEAATRTKGANRPDALAVLSLFLATG